jgi:spermidine synthase
VGFLPDLLTATVKHLTREKVLFTGQGLYSSVRVIQKGRRLELFTGKNHLQSAYTPGHPPRGTVFDWYLVAPFFSGNFAGHLENLLVLGLGGGAAVKLYNQAYRVEHITGVELDPLIIGVAKKYFHLDDPNLTIVQGSAAAYVQTTTEKFALILLDTFQENIFADACASWPFLERVQECLLPHGVLLVNGVAAEAAHLEMGRKLARLFPTVFALKVHRNLFYLGTNSPAAPARPEEATRLLVNAARAYPLLRFLSR